ncbi:MAG: Holliday junction resolvase [Crenarchaeota archaeon]|nr:Holliday junction resolvase [Thermoproteota archaeon]
MTGSARRRGFDAERELALRLWSKGFAVVRGPASGSRARRLIYPDLVALYHGRIFVFEVKYRRSGGPLYVEAEQARRLEEFARRAGGEAYIAVKVPRRGWRLVPLESAAYTPSGRLRIGEEELETAPTLEEFIRSVVNAALPLEGGESRPGKLSSQPSSGEGSGRE